MSKKNPNLTAEQKLVFFEEGTEPPGSSELNYEKREGAYYCANCDVKLFESKLFLVNGTVTNKYLCILTMSVRLLNTKHAEVNQNSSRG